MTALICTPLICSAAVLASAFIGIRPMDLAVRLPFAVAISWALS